MKPYQFILLVWQIVIWILIALCLIPILAFIARRFVPERITRLSTFRVSRSDHSPLRNFIVRIFAPINAYLQNVEKLITNLCSNQISRFDLILLIVITGFGSLIRLAYLSLPIRYDEAYSYLFFIRRGVRTIISNYAALNNHILHSILVYISTRLFGNQVGAIRLPALIAGILLIPTAYWVGAYLFNRNAALIAAALVASSTDLIEFSVNSRGYMLLCFFTLLAMIIAYSIKREHNLAAWMFFTIISSFGVYTIPIMIYPLASIYLWLFLSWVIKDTTPIRNRNFLGSLLVSPVLITLFSGLLYLPAIKRTGLNSLINNRFIAPTGMVYFIDSLRNTLSYTWYLWNRDTNTIITLLLLIGLLAYLFASKQINGDHLPFTLVLVVTFLIIILAMRKAPEWPRVLLFALPIYFLFGSGGVTKLFESLLLKKPKIRLVIFPSFALLILLSGGIGISKSNSIYYSDQTGTLRDAQTILRDLGPELKSDQAIIAYLPSDFILQYYSLFQENSKIKINPPNPEKYDSFYLVINKTFEHTVDKVIDQAGYTNIVDTSTLKLVRSYETADIYFIKRSGY